MSQDSDKFKQSSETFVDQFDSFIKFAVIHHDFISSIMGTNWPWDSDVDVHYFGGKSLFKNMKPTKDSAQTASGEVIPILGKGDVEHKQFNLMVRKIPIRNFSKYVYLIYYYYFLLMY